MPEGTLLRAEPRAEGRALARARAEAEARAPAPRTRSAGVQEGGPSPFLRAGIAGLGTALPARAVPSADVAARIGVEDGWIERRTGISSRRRLGPSERLSDLAVEAARAALDDAALEGPDLDL